MIPGLIKIQGCPWPILPEGIHPATLEEVQLAFATNVRRNLLFSGLVRGAGNLADAGCRSLFLDGSFVTGKPNPGDYDACWDPISVCVDKLDPVFLMTKHPRSEQKQKYFGEYFPSSSIADGNGNPFINFFQIEKNSGEKKGIIQIHLPLLKTGGSL